MNRVAQFEQAVFGAAQSTTDSNRLYSILLDTRASSVSESMYDIAEKLLKNEKENSKLALDHLWALKKNLTPEQQGGTIDILINFYQEKINILRNKEEYIRKVSKESRELLEEKRKRDTEIATVKQEVADCTLEIDRLVVRSNELKYKEQELALIEEQLKRELAINANEVINGLYEIIMIPQDTSGEPFGFDPFDGSAPAVENPSPAASVQAPAPPAPTFVPLKTTEASPPPAFSAPTQAPNDLVEEPRNDSLPTAPEINRAMRVLVHEDENEHISVPPVQEISPVMEPVTTQIAIDDIARAGNQPGRQIFADIGAMQASILTPGANLSDADQVLPEALPVSFPKSIVKTTRGVVIGEYYYDPTVYKNSRHYVCNSDFFRRKLSQAVAVLDKKFDQTLYAETLQMMQDAHKRITESTSLHFEVSTNEILNKDSLRDLIQALKVRQYTDVSSFANRLRSKIDFLGNNYFVLLSEQIERYREGAVS